MNTEPATSDPRPCRGQNTNICVGEGCYGEACIANHRYTVSDFYNTDGVAINCASCGEDWPCSAAVASEA